MTTEIEIRAPDDFHVHLRDGPLLTTVLPHSARSFARILAMPNLEPPITTGKEATNYRMAIKMTGLGAHPLPHIEILSTIKILASTSPQTISDAKLRGVIAGKLYPANVTTNSTDGVTDFRALYPIFEEMQRVGMVLALHGEYPDPKIPEENREEAFLPILVDIAHTFPRLRIIFEHISTRRAIECVLELPRTVAATVTAHHLLLTKYDIKSPHELCMPILKNPDDCTALQNVVLDGHPKFFFGSDSAPHARERKEKTGKRVFGIFSAPVVLPLLARFFVRFNQAKRLEPFVSLYGANHYDLPLNRGTVRLTRTPWIVPDAYDNIVPLMAGKTLEWHATRHP